LAFLGFSLAQGAICRQLRLMNVGNQVRLQLFVLAD
jgi:hypothetical protein